MVKIKSKAEILERLQTERRRLESNLEGLSDEALASQVIFGTWTVKDLLAHLAEWEARMPVWMAEARAGRREITPDEGLTWGQLDEFNRRVYNKYRDMPPAEVRAFFHRAHQALMDMVEGMPEEEIITSGVYAFTGKGAVYNWLVAYAEHDRWGKTEIRRWRKSQKA